MLSGNRISTLLAAVSLGLALCLAASPPAAAAEKTTKFIVLLDWFVNPDHAPLFVALRRGYFRDVGLDVELIAPADPNDPPKLVAAGKGDVAITYQPQLYLQVDQGLPLVRIGTVINRPLNSLLVLANGPIKRIADLKGRRIGYSVGGVEEVMLSTMLATAGLTLKDVELINVNFSLAPALMAGQVDAVIGAFRNFELNQLAIEGRPGRVFPVEQYGVPAYDELILVAKRDRLGDPRLRRFLAALTRGVAYLRAHPAKSWALFIKGRKDLDTELNRRAWRDTLPDFARDPAALDRDRYRRFAEFLKRHGLIKAVLPLARYAVDLR